MAFEARKYHMHETGNTQSSAKMAAHKALIEKFLDQGYEILSQETKNEEGLKNELINKSLITILTPPRRDLPMIKFEAKEVFGKYNYHEQSFEAFEFPRFELLTFKKGSDVKTFNDPWERLDEEQE